MQYRIVYLLPLTCTESTGTGSDICMIIRLCPMSSVMSTIEGDTLSGVKEDDRRGSASVPMAATVDPSVPLNAYIRVIKVTSPARG